MAEKGGRKPRCHANTQRIKDELENNLFFRMPLGEASDLKLARIRPKTLCDLEFGGRDSICHLFVA